MQFVRRSFFLSLVTVLFLAVALLAPGDDARAGTAFTSYYADPSGLCAGLTPCFSSIQEAVDNSSGPGGSQIFAFPGLYEQDIDLTFQGSSVGGSIGALRLTTVDSSGQAAAGTATIRGGTPLRAVGFGADVTIEGFIFDAMTGDCVRIASSAEIAVTDSTANGCGDGVDDGSETGDDGFDLKTTGTGGITMSNVEASGHTGIYADGIDVVSAGPVTISGSTTNNNTGPDDADGIDIYETAGDVTLTDITANGNADDGVYVETAGNATLTNVTTEDNGDDGTVAFIGTFITRLPAGGGVNVLTATGLTSTGNAFDGLFADVAGTATVLDSTLDVNGDDGADIEAVAVAITNTSASGNEDDGVDLLAETVEVTNTRAASNGEDGLRLEVESSVSIDRAVLSGNGAALPGQRDGAFITPVGPSIELLSVTNSIVSDNFGSGIKVHDLTGSAHILRGNAFCGHPEEGFGVFALGATVDAHGNWWGESSGPTHPGIPSGLGDRIIDGSNGGAGTVDYGPWLSMGEITLPAEVFAGQMNPGSVIFKSADSAFMLEEGPGPDLGDLLPFEVATLEGTVATEDGGSGASVGGYFRDSALDFTWMPSGPGQATVTVQGPCGMAAMASTDVVEGGEPAIWGDNDCSGAADPVDSLLTLRFDAGLPLDTCFEFGVTYDIVAASSHIWADIDCSDGVDPVDSLKLLRFDAGLSVAQEAGCPAMGSDVLVKPLPSP